MKQQQITADNVNQLAADILKDAKDVGATHAEVDIHIETGYSATARMGEPETLEHHRDNNISITLYDGKRTGSVSTSDIRTESLKTAVAAARNIARYTQEDPASGLAELECLAKNVPHLDLYFPWDLRPQDAMELARECDQYGLNSDKRIINSDGSNVSTHQSLNAYANSHGFNHHYQTTRHTISSVLVATDDNAMQRDYYYYTVRDHLDMPSIQQIANRAAKRTVARLNPRAIKTGKFPVLFSPETARSLLGHFISAICGDALYKQSSFLLNRLGDSIFPDWFEISEHPHLPRAMGSAPFDGNGLLTKDKFFIKDGKLESYALGIYGARRLQMESTANAGGVYNVTVKLGNSSFEHLLQELNTGFLVTEVMGQGVNIVTGDYSRGAAGFWVENGEIKFAVDEATIAGNLNDMFKNIRCVGNDIDKRGNVRTPSILVDGMIIAGGES